MICRECPKVALYQVPRTTKFYCKDHRELAVAACKKQLHERPRETWPEPVGVFAQQRLRPQ